MLLVLNELYKASSAWHGECLLETMNTRKDELTGALGMRSEELLAVNDPQSFSDDWTWKELEPREEAQGTYTRTFRLFHLAPMQRLFATGELPDRDWLMIDPSALDTEGRRFHIYHVAGESKAKGAVAFLRNENWAGVENWTLPLEHPPQPGLAAEFSARWYPEDFGGFQADIFLPVNNAIWSSGMGSNGAAKHSNQNCLVCKILRLPLYYVEVRLTDLARHAFAIEFTE